MDLYGGKGADENNLVEILVVRVDSQELDLLC